MPTLTALASKKLAELETAHLKRSLKDSAREDGIHIVRNGKRLLSFSCNDYLGLTHRPEVKEAAIQAIRQYGAGAGASRLVTGNHPFYSELEAKLATWKGTEAALVFGSGYLANIGLIPALAGKDDCIIADKLVHACMIDGGKLSGAKLFRFKHNDVKDAERLLKLHRGKYKQCLLLTEGVFSMDGDTAPLGELVALAEAYDATVICDDAHLLNPEYRIPDGKTTFVCRFSRQPRLIRMGTLSKAVGGYGGYVCGPQMLINYLHNAARSLVYSTALPPAVVAAASVSLEIMQREPELLAMPQKNAAYFTSLLGVPQAKSAIVPIIIGESGKALEASATLEEEGFLVGAIRPPTVLPGTARLRVAFSALHTNAMIESLVASIKQLGVA